MNNIESASPRSQIGINGHRPPTWTQTALDTAKTCGRVLYDIFYGLIKVVAVPAVWVWETKPVQQICEYMRKLRIAFVNLVSHLYEKGQNVLYKKQVKEIVQDFIDQRVPQDVIDKKLQAMPKSQQKRFNEEIIEEEKKNIQATDDAIRKLQSINASSRKTVEQASQSNHDKFEKSAPRVSIGCTPSISTPPTQIAGPSQVSKAPSTLGQSPGAVIPAMSEDARKQEIAALREKLRILEEFENVHQKQKAHQKQKPQQEQEEAS